MSMHRALPTLLLAAACTPNNLVVTSGSYVAFISDSTSLSLLKGTVVPEDFPINYNIDCREFETAADKAALELEDPIKICTENQGWPPVNEVWPTQSGYKVVSEELNPWRGEALMTSEGDLQLAFHHRVLGGADTRYIMSVDPDFAPTHCVEDEAGELVREPYDGDWIAEWSKELEWIDTEAPYPDAFAHMEPYLDGGRLYFLNAFAFQYDPTNIDGRDWDLPDDWTSGAGQGKFSEEFVFHRTTRYGEPSLYNALAVSGTTETQYQGLSADDLFWCELAAGDVPLENQCMLDMEGRVRDIADATHDELEKLFKPVKNEPAIFDYAPIAHINYWREPDGIPSGFDGWGQLEYSYVVFSADSVLEEGGRAEGAFTLMFDGGLTQTRVFVKGTFEVDKIKKDRWVTPDLPEIKLAQNDIEVCSAASPEDAVGDE
jgi:hypothetical protein